MNIYFLQSAAKWFSLMIVTLTSAFGGLKVNLKTASVDNVNMEKNKSIINQVKQYETDYQFNKSLPSEAQQVIQEGQIGLSYIDDETKEEVILVEPVKEIIEVGSGGPGEYTGRLTSYGPDCPGCSAVGNVACFTKEHTNHSLIFDGVTYQDSEFGEVRILAADHQKFPCGTIVYVDTGTAEPFYGVVLDTGSSMRYAWREEGYVWMDLAFESQEAAKKGNYSSKNTTFSVKRWGW